MRPPPSPRDALLARSRTDLQERSRQLVLRKVALILGWHLALWSFVASGIAISMHVGGRQGILSAGALVASCTIVSTALAWAMLRQGLSGTVVVTGLLVFDALALVLGLNTLIPEVPVALGVAVLPVVGLAVVGGARASVTLSILQNLLLVYLWLEAPVEDWARTVGIEGAGRYRPLDVAAFTGVSMAGALLATVAAKSGFAGMEVLRKELAAHTRHLAAANAVLVVQNEALQSFNTAVGHDLRGPLTTARMSIELMREAAARDEVQETADEALEAIDRLTSMVEELLRVARSGGVLEAKQPVGLDVVTRDALANLTARIRSSGAMVRVSGDLPTVLGNRSLLAEVIQNLVENAIKYGGKPVPRIHIVGGQVGDRAFVEVEDDGPGVPEASRSLVFADFEQLNPDTSGVGAGLALVRRLVEAHDGSVEITDGQVLGGACFRVCLPAHTPERLRQRQHG